MVDTTLPEPLVGEGIPRPRFEIALERTCTRFVGEPNRRHQFPGAVLGGVLRANSVVVAKAGPKVGCDADVAAGGVGLATKQVDGGH